MTVNNEDIKRSELVFLYDIQYANPNGDPLDDNKPRIDPSTGINLVSDVRLKRTIRDHLNNFKGEEIFVREIEDDGGHIQDAKMRAEDFLYDEDNNKLDKSKLTLNSMKEIMKNNILNSCIDVRLFGGTIPIELKKNKGSSITLTGPVQFRFGKSLHKVEPMFIKGTGAFASGKDKGQKTFREEYIVPYSLISFYGIINENTAKHSNLTNEDIKKLVDAIWNGTKNLISRSKMGQTPRLLIKVNYKENNYHIGDLDRCLFIKSDVNDEEIRSSNDYVIDITKLIEILLKNKDNIENIEYVWDDRLKLICNGDEFKFNVENIEFNEIEI